MSPLEIARQWCNRTSWVLLASTAMDYNLRVKVLYYSHVLYLSVAKALIFKWLAPREEHRELAECRSCSSVDFEGNKSAWPNQEPFSLSARLFWWKTISLFFFGPIVFLWFSPMTPLRFRFLHESAHNNFEHVRILSNAQCTNTICKSHEISIKNSSIYRFPRNFLRDVTFSNFYLKTCFVK